MRLPIAEDMRSVINKILFIRRDNIGDLVCTTPAISAVRQSFPHAKIGVLVNTYNVEAVRNNPDIDEIYSYEKAKHVPGKNKFSVWMDNARLLLRIRSEHYDTAIGCGSYSPRLARYTCWTAAAMTIGYLKDGGKSGSCYTDPLIEPHVSLHEAERTMRLLTPLGLASAAGPLRVFSSPDAVERFNEYARSSGGLRDPRIVMHISSRKPDNRWPVEKFILLGRELVRKYRTRIILLWSPGGENNVYHPGDDEKAQAIVSALGRDAVAYRTDNLADLIGALSCADIVICCDGGAMHIAAGLGKPIVAVWGSSASDRWRPFGVPHVLLSGDNRRAENVGLDPVIAAVEKLLMKE